jgi:hypothetical protein
LNHTFAALARAVRPLAAGEPARRAKASCSIGVGCPSVGGQRTSGSAPTVRVGQTGACIQRPCLRRHKAKKARSTQPGGCSVSPRSCASLPLRRVGALSNAVQSQLIMPTMVVPSRSRSNPSVEGTHNGGARLFASASSAAPSCAPHVKR